MSHQLLWWHFKKDKTMDIDRKEQEIELLNYMAKDLMVCEERCAGGAARVLNALLALYDVCEEEEPNVC